MEVIYESNKGAELLTAKCDPELALHEIKQAEPVFSEPKDTGSAENEDGTVRKQNRGVFMESIYTPLYAECSPIALVLKEFVQTAKQIDFTHHSAFQSLYLIDGFTVLFSGYKNGDYYKAHRDSVKLTALLWLGEKKFSGGDFYFPDFNHTIPYEQGKLIMFPSYYRHEVTPISTDQEGFVRYCASAFIN